MSPYDRFAEVMARIGVAPSVARIRQNDTLRAELNTDNLARRVEAAVAKLEKVAADLEKAL